MATGFYIGVDGKARKVKGAYIGIDGVARKVKKGYIGDENGVARLCYTADSFDPVFSNNGWEDVIVACQTKNVPDSWNVGDQMTMTIDGVDYAVDIIGKNHDDYADGSGKAPLTFQLHDCYSEQKEMNSSSANIWKNSRMRQTYLPTFLTMLPNEVRTSIREVNKQTCVGNQSNTIETHAEKLFLLSEIEVLGTVTQSSSGEGSKYTYYEVGNSIIKSRNGTANTWLLRSPYKSDSRSFCLISSNGIVTTTSATTERGVSFAFCF